jgi:hypothetical protein
MADGNLSREILYLRRLLNDLAITCEEVKEQIDRIEEEAAASGNPPPQAPTREWTGPSAPETEGSQPSAETERATRRATTGSEAQPPEIKVGGRVKILPRQSSGEPHKSAKYIGRIFVVTKVRLVYVFFNVGTPEQPEIIQRQRKYVRPVF